MVDNPLRQLPGVDRLLGHLSASLLIETFGRSLAVEAIRKVLNDHRDQLRDGLQDVPSDVLLLDEARQTLEGWLAPTLRRVINATGVIIHTNLGRAPLGDSALKAIQAVAQGYSTLEYDTESGSRGSRSVHAETLLQRITGAEAVLIVNNNAAAVLLALTALAGPSDDYQEGRQVIISRGQLVEIGGGFRMPDIMAQSRARMVEVGTTNRTHLRDYENSIGSNTAMLLRVHRSNFAMVGFTTEPSLRELIQVARGRGVFVVDDLGSGALYDTGQFGLTPEPIVQASVEAGADVTMFSGDKLLGGPQAGVLVGKSAVINRLKGHPLTRAIRPDKLCLAGLTATLSHYLKGDALKQIPVWRMISMPLDEVEGRAHRWADTLIGSQYPVEVIDGKSAVGGGSLPGETLPTALLAIQISSADTIAARLRVQEPPIITRIEKDKLIIDPRTVLDRDEHDLLTGLLAALNG